MESDIKHLLVEVDRCMHCDQASLRNRLGSLRKMQRDAQPAAEQLQRIRAEISASLSRREHRKANCPTVSYADDLPVSLRREEIAEAIRHHQVVILAGETGSGKTTQLPKICLSIGRGIGGFIGHTQPRRIAARTVASRIAEELASPLGEAVGYKIRFSDRSQRDSYIKLMTDGILLAELQSDRHLSQYDTLIIDEAHERSLNIDFLLGYLKKLLPRRPDFKLIITSATIDTGRFSRHFNDAPVIEVSGRTYPVDIRYRPLVSDDEQGVDVISGILSAVDELAQLDKRGDILVFLNGEREIRDVAEALRKHHPAQTEILPLYSRLSASEQNRIFQPSRFRRIVLATNVAETSLTVPGIRYVIDPGTARISRYSYRSKVQRLPIEIISRSSADQRAGRCGRVSAGVCIRLYSEEDFLARKAFTEPEIQRTNLASVILQMRVLGLGNPEEFPFIDPPDSRYVNDGFRLLRELGAIDESRQLTPMGSDLARLPVDPKLGRMVLAARDFNCLNEAMIITSALSIQDPRERPVEKQQKADERHAVFRDADSDFVSLLNLWREYQEKQKHLSNNQLRKYCRNEFLSFMRMKEWKETYQQLRALVKNMGMKLNQVESEYAEIHRALLTGLLGNIGLRDDSASNEKERKKPGKKAQRYQGVRNSEFFIFPGSGLAKKPPRWLMSAELVETSRLYARKNARIEPEWIEPAASHLVKRSYTEPYWDERQGRVSAFESVSLHGLVLTAKRRVNYEAINVEVSREIFIREALVNGRLRTKAEYHRHNRALIGEALSVEEKTRRRDVFADEEVIFQFFDQIIPERICSNASFENWRKKAEKLNQDILKLGREDVISETASINDRDYPCEMDVNGVLIPLSYCFDPGGDEDGVTATIPLGAINQLDEESFEWLVPGFILGKVTAILKGLPKQLRKQLVPIPDSAKSILRKMNHGSDYSQVGLMAAISSELIKVWNLKVSPQELRKIQLPAHLFMRFIIVDPKAKKLASGRDLNQLRHTWADNVKISSAVTVGMDKWPHKGICSWDFGDLPEAMEIEQGGSRYKVFPALVDHTESVGVDLLDSRQRAKQAHANGLRRLVMQEITREIKYLRRNLPGIDTMCLQYASVGSCDELKDDVLNAAVDQCFFSDGYEVREKEVFYSRLKANRGRLVEVANAICDYLEDTLKVFYELKQYNGHQHPKMLEESYKDIQSQINGLVFKGFLVATSKQWLPHIPRFLSGIRMRLEKLALDAQSDASRSQRIKPLISAFHELQGQEGIDCQALESLRWMLEEFRVSLFAQQLKTSIPVSPQRIQKQIELCKTGG